MMKKGWKLLTKRSPIDPFGSIGYSFWAWNEGKTFYEDDAWTIRKVGDGPLAVFDSLVSVRDFLGADFFGSTSLYCARPCLFIPSRHSELWFQSSTGTRPDDAGRRFCVTKGTETPCGTLFADAVYVISEAAEEEFGVESHDKWRYEVKG